MVVRVNGSTGIITVSGTSGAPSLRGPDGNSGISFDGDQVIISSSGLVAATFNNGVATIGNLEFSPGSSGTPSVAPSGDLNTGIYFPAADTIGFAEGGNEAARIDSSGRLGIGTTSAAGNTGTRLVLHDSSSPRLRLTNSTTGETASDGGEISLDGSNLHIENRESAAIKFYSGGSERAQLDSSGNLKFNSGYGSVATAYGVRAWVNFLGTGTVTIRDSGNVSSITDNGTGDYTANFTTAMPDDDYCVFGSCVGSTSAGFTSAIYPSGNTISTSSFRFKVLNTDGSYYDLDMISVAAIR